MIIDPNAMPKVLQLYLEISQYPILAPTIRERDSAALWLAGLAMSISPGKLDRGGALLWNTFLGSGTDIIPCGLAVADDGDDDTTRTGTNVTSVTNVTPLHLSTQSNCIAVGEALLSAGAEVDAVDRNGNTPLPNAVFHSGGAGGLGSHASRSRVVSSCS